MTKRAPSRDRWNRVAERELGGCYRSTERACVVPRACWRELFCEKLGMRAKKEKRSRKKRQEGLWKLTLLMKIRKGRGFPQQLEKSLAKDARLFHSSHRPNNKYQLENLY
jgi:hypothetical protein